MFFYCFVQTGLITQHNTHKENFLYNTLPPKIVLDYITLIYVLLKRGNLVDKQRGAEMTKMLSDDAETRYVS